MRDSQDLSNPSQIGYFNYSIRLEDTETTDEAALAAQEPPFQLLDPIRGY